MKTAFRLRMAILAGTCAILALLLAGCPLPVLPAASSSTSTGAITGKVAAQGPDGPAGVTVSAELTDGIRSITVQRTLSPRTAGKAVAAARATTGSNGQYSISGLAPGVYTVSALSRDGQARAIQSSVTVSAGSTTQALVMILMRTGEIRGSVTLADGSDPTGVVAFIAGSSCSAMADGSGNYTMQWVPAGTNYTLVMSKDGWISAIRNVSVSVNETTTVAPVVLAPYVPPQTTGSVSGTATLKDAPNSAGVFVYLLGTSYIAATDAQGAFALTGVAPGTYTIMASKEGYASQSVTVTVPVGPAGPVSFVLPSLGPFYVSYEANGGSGNAPVDPTAYLQGYRAVVLGAGGLERTGWTYTGWNTAADGSGTPYAQGQTFFIASSSVTLYAMWTRVVTPVDVSGYWDLTFSVNGQAMRPMLMFIRQTGTALSASFEFPMTGSVQGTELSLSGLKSGGDGTFMVYMQGTVSETGITGTLSAPEVSLAGTFTLTRSTGPFGHLDLQGSCAGTPLSLNTDFATAEAPSIRTSCSFEFDLSPSIPGRFRFEGPELSPKTYSVAVNGGPGTLQASLWASGPPMEAAGGSVTVSRYDGSGIAGSYNLNFPDGSYLNGSFDLTFNYGGTYTIEGIWNQTQISAPTPVQTYSSWSNVNTTTMLSIEFFDDQLDAGLWLNVPGYLTVGDNQAWLNLWWERHGGVHIDEQQSDTGNLHVTTLGAHNASGTFSASFPAGGSVSGSFNVSF